MLRAKRTHIPLSKRPYPRQFSPSVRRMRAATASARLSDRIDRASAE